MPRVCVHVIVALVIVGQQPASSHNQSDAGQRSPFRSGVDLIAMNVTVTDGSRRYVTDLDRQDFRIFEDGRAQEVTFFQKSSLPLALALLIDTSDSMDEHLAVAQEVAIGFVRALGPTDVASLIDFDSRVRIRQDFTNDWNALEQAIRQTVAAGRTALYNAVYIALKELNKTIQNEPLAESRRRAIVILSDGEDTSSLVGFDEVLDLAARSDTAIYAIGLFGLEAPGVQKSRGAKSVLRQLAQQTGGRAFFPSEAKELTNVYGEIRAELANQYFLAYVSTNARRDGHFRRVAVRVERAGVATRTRPGYYAPSK